MSDRLFYGNFFFEDCPVSLALVSVYMIMSLVPSMFQVSSLLLLDLEKVIDGSQWWRPFSGLFTCNHPDTFLLGLFMLYISRQFEFYHGSVAYVSQMLLAVVFGGLPFLALGASKDFSYFKGHYIVEYALTVPVSLATAGVFSQFRVNLWKAKVTEGCQLPQGFGYALVLFLCVTHRFAAESAIITGWNFVTGGLMMLLTKGVCGRCKKAPKQ